jgi:hypothetical protein
MTSNFEPEEHTPTSKRRKISNSPGRVGMSEFERSVREEMTVGRIGERCREGPFATPIIEVADDLRERFQAILPFDVKYIEARLYEINAIIQGQPSHHEISERDMEIVGALNVASKKLRVILLLAEATNIVGSMDVGDMSPLHELANAGIPVRPVRKIKFK